MAERVTASAPGKLMLFGEHAVVYGVPCLVTAVDRRMKVSLERRRDKKLVIKAKQVGLPYYVRNIKEAGKGETPKPARFTEKLVANFYEQYGLSNGLEVTTDCQFSDKYGFGASAAVTAALGYGLSQLYGIKQTKEDLFNLGYRTVIGVQGVGSGFDVAAAIWGGTIYYIKGKKIESIKCKDHLLAVGYTGVKADTPALVRQVAELRRQEPLRVAGIFSQIKEVVEEARVVLEKGTGRSLGRLMERNQRLLRELGVSSQKIEDLIEACGRGGAWGAKLSGAGGGDCIIASVAEESGDRIRGEITQAGGGMVKVGYQAEGVRLESE